MLISKAEWLARDRFGLTVVREFPRVGWAHFVKLLALALLLSGPWLGLLRQ